MTRRILSLAACVAFFLLQAWLRPPPPSHRPGAVSVLGASAQPVLVAIAWAQAQFALDDRRLADALDRLRLLEAIDPDSPEATVFRAHVLAHNVAQRAGPDGEAARVAEAVAILERAGERFADPRPPLALGQLMLEHRMWDRALDAQLSKLLGKSPRAVAVEALEAALSRAPGSGKIRRLAMTAWRFRGAELLARGGETDAAVAAFARSAALAADVRDDVLGRRLAIAWEAVVRAAATGTAAEIGEAQSAFVPVFTEWTLVRPPGDDLESVLAVALIRGALTLAEGRLSVQDGAGALSRIRLVHTIRNIVARSLDRSRISSLQDLAAEDRVLGVLDGVERLQPGLSADVAALRALVAAW